MVNNWIEDFHKNLFYRMNENTRMIEISLSKLSENEIWFQPNPQLNSVGNLILHICGNMTQYVISSLGGKQDTRNREEEFSIRDGYTKEELLSKLTHTIHLVKGTMENTKESEYLRNRSVQGFELSGLGVALHVVEHYSYHTGQIAWWVKYLKDIDLGFYQNMDLSIRNP